MSDNANLYGYFQKNFPANLDSQLLLTERQRSVSYAEADETSARIANSLLAQGAVAGDRVTVQVDKSAENLFLYLACLRAGLVYHPLNTAYTAAELGYFLGDAEPTIVVCSSTAVAVIESIVAAADENSGLKSILTLDADGSGSLMVQAEQASAEPVLALCQGADMAAFVVLLRHHG